MTFFKSNFYDIIKLFLNQFAMAVFGIIVSVSTVRNDLLSVGAGVLGVALYFYLVYTMMWPIGGKDRIRVDTGRIEGDFGKPLRMALIANIPNFVLAAVYPIGLYLFPRSPIVSGAALICRSISMMLQGYYIGLTETYFAANPFTYLLTPFLGIAVTVAAYLLGYYNIRLTKKPVKK